MNILVQIIAAFVGSAGFAIVFHVRSRMVFYAALGGLVCWSAYLCAQAFSVSEFVATVAAAVVITLYSETFARMSKAPATQYLISGLIPLVPGGSLYYFMSGLIRQDWTAAASYGSATAVCVLGIAVGISATLSIWDMVRRTAKLIQNRQRTFHGKDKPGS